MTIAGFVWRNALRNKRRAILTVLSVAVSLFLLTILLTALKLLVEPPTTDEASLRIAVRHRVSLATPLPEKYLYRIERLPGVAVVSRFTWFGGIYQDEASSNFAQFACDPDRIFRIFTELNVDPRAQEAFVREKNACIVGRKLRERFGWKLGERILLQGNLWPCDVELIIAGEYRSEGLDETLLFFRHDYFDELLGKPGVVGTFWIRATEARVIPELMERIDAMFRNSAAETKTETERTFQLGFISMLGNVRLFLGSLCTVVLFTMLLVTVSTMAMAIRERLREISILKAVGFNGLMIVTLILAESLSLAFAGGILGCSSAKILAETLDVYRLSQGFLPVFPVTMDTLATGMLVSLGLGVISSIAPAWTSLRLAVVEGLRELD